MCKNTTVTAHALIWALMSIAGTFGAPARAVDGVFEINQTCATNPGEGCFPSDSPGFPVLISTPGSYRLTGNLTATTQHGILVSTDDVTIDLNGFSISGPVTCIGEPVTSCTSFAFNGIQAQIYDRITVRNGTVKGFNIGVRADNQFRAEALQVVSNETWGILANRGAKVTDCIVERNGGIGVNVDRGSILRANVIRGNGNAGIRAQAFGNLLIGNVATSNGGWGLGCDGGCSLIDNTASENLGSGLRSADGATIKGNSVKSNSGIDIETGNGSVIIGNSVFDGSITAGHDAVLSRNSVDGVVAVGDRCLLDGNHLRFYAGGNNCAWVHNIFEWCWDVDSGDISPTFWTPNICNNGSGLFSQTVAVNCECPGQ